MINMIEGVFSGVMAGEALLTLTGYRQTRVRAIRWESPRPGPSNGSQMTSSSAVK